jgi:hypothetical protein
MLFGGNFIFPIPGFSGLRLIFPIPGFSGLRRNRKVMVERDLPLRENVYVVFEGPLSQRSPLKGWCL